jgi:membrane protease subunit (stomatin/prohibitin family)
VWYGNDVPGRPGVQPAFLFFEGATMGILDFVKGGVKELAIARPDSAKGFWVYKHPDQTIPMKAQLTVDSDEVALFFKNGAYVGTLSTGRHTLDGSSIPFLGQLVDKFTGGNIFICEVFFVTTREMPSIKFGTSIGDVQDPQTKMRVRMMVYGEFSAKVIDPTKLVIGLVGQQAVSDNEAFVGWFKSQVQKTMKDGIAELIVKQDWPMLKVTSGAYTDEIEAATLQGVRKNIESYGVEVVRFGDFSVSMDQADKERMDKLVDRMAYQSAAASGPGGMAGMAQYAQVEMMMGAAEGMKTGGGAGLPMAGAALGMGFGMAQMAPQMAPIAAAAAPVAETRDQIMNTLKQLGDLKAAGVLTTEEFDAKKKELLAKL